MGDAFASVTFQPGPAGVGGNPGETGAKGESQDERDPRDSPIPACRALGVRRGAASGLEGGQGSGAETPRGTPSRKADDILDRLAAGIPRAAAGFTALFSALPFPGADLECVWQRDNGGRCIICRILLV